LSLRNRGGTREGRDGGLSTRPATAQKRHLTEPSIMGYPLDSGSRYLLWSLRRRFGCRHHRRVGGRRSGNCLLHEPIKQLAATFAGSAIEPKRELIQVVRQMLRFLYALVGAE